MGPATAPSPTLRWAERSWCTPLWPKGGWHCQESQARLWLPATVAALDSRSVFPLREMGGEAAGTCRAIQKWNKNRTGVDMSQESQNGDKGSLNLVMRVWSVLHQ